MLLPSWLVSQASQPAIALRGVFSIANGPFRCDCSGLYSMRGGKLGTSLPPYGSALLAELGSSLALGWSQMGWHRLYHSPLGFLCGRAEAVGEFLALRIARPPTW